MRATVSGLVVMFALALAGLVGCEDRTVSEERKVDVKNDGTVVRENEKVTENADGSVTKTETKTVDKAGDDDDHDHDHDKKVTVDVDKKD